jgi:hypothetical protein
MKRNYTLLLFLLATVSILAQTPEKMSYQLVLRGASNTLLTNQQVGIQISILQTTITGSAVYTETQTATTNINGLVSLEIGSGTSSDNFSAIDWSAGPFFIKTATDASGGSNYTIIGTSQLMSVPYALYAKTAGNDELKENTANKSTNVVTDAASDVKFPSVKSVKTYVDPVQDDADANEIASATSDATLQGYIDALEARIAALESASATQIFYEDSDNDGYGDINSTIVASAAPNGYVSDNTDCNDNNSSINPGAEEIFTDDIDNNCDGLKTVLVNCSNCKVGAGPYANDSNSRSGRVCVGSPEAGYTPCTTIVNTAPATVGDLRDGGIVFWVDPDNNTHGLVCALQDYANLVEWGCYGTDLPSVPTVPWNGPAEGSGAEIGDGEPNTTGILADCSTAPAALAARALGVEWFLPSINELQEMYLHRATLEAVSGFNAFSDYYWSSTESGSQYMWRQDSNGFRGASIKNAPGNVRAVRAF